MMTASDAGVPLRSVWQIFAPSDRKSWWVRNAYVACIVRTNSSSSAAAGAASATAAGTTDKRAPTLYFNSTPFSTRAASPHAHGYAGPEITTFASALDPFDTSAHKNLCLRYAPLSLLAKLILNGITINLILLLRVVE